MHNVRSLLKIEPITASIRSNSQTSLLNLREDCTTLSSHFLRAVICNRSADSHVYMSSAYRDHHLDTYEMRIKTAINSE
jgi:hypothetical protein